MDHHNFLKNGHLYDRHGKLSTIKYRRNSFHHRIFINLETTCSTYNLWFCNPSNEITLLARDF